MKQAWNTVNSRIALFRNSSFCLKTVMYRRQEPTFRAETHIRDMRDVERRGFIWEGNSAHFCSFCSKLAKTPPNLRLNLRKCQNCPSEPLFRGPEWPTEDPPGRPSELHFQALPGMISMHAARTCPGLYTGGAPTAGTGGTYRGTVRGAGVPGGV